MATRRLSGTTLCWPFNSHCGELSYASMFLLLMWIDEISKQTNKQTYVCLSDYVATVAAISFK